MDNYSIDEIFKKEVGYDVNSVIKKLNDIGIPSKDIDDMTNYFKQNISQEIERRNIHRDYRFLVLNLILFNLFKRAIYFQKRLNEMVLEINDIEFRKEI